MPFQKTFNSLLNLWKTNLLEWHSFSPANTLTYSTEWNIPKKQNAWAID